MNNRFETIIRKARGFSLTTEDKVAMHSRVLSHMKENPVPPSSVGIVSPFSIPVINEGGDRHRGYNNEWSTLFALSVRHKKFMPIIIALMLMLGGGTSLAAQSSLPGDTLYPVKHMNENVRSFFAFSTEADAKAEARIARERLEEAEKLAAKGEISAEAKADIEANFTKHAGKVRTLVNELEAKGEVDAAAKINAEFESALTAHQSTFSSLSASDSNNKAMLSEINSSVSAYLGAAMTEESQAVKEEKKDTRSSLDENLNVQGTIELNKNSNANSSTSSPSNSSSSNSGGNSSSSSVDTHVNTNTTTNINVGGGSGNSSSSSTNGTTGSGSASSQGSINLGL